MTYVHSLGIEDIKSWIISGFGFFGFAILSVDLSVNDWIGEPAYQDIN